MQEIIKIIIGLIVLFIGFPIGNFLAKITEEELKSGKKWFKIIILIFCFFSIYGLLSRKDYILFSSLFIIIITSRSIKKY